MNLDKHYSIKDIEKYFRANDKFVYKNGSDFIVPMPPPNLTGYLHIGHALVFTLQDMNLRYKYMKGYNPVWLAGTDHAGISGQMMFEKFLIANNIAHDSSEDKMQHMNIWKQEKADMIQSQSDQMFFNIDWSKARYTLDSQFSNAVLDAFIKLFDAGLIYRAKRLVRWDVKLQTAISDLEVNTRSVKGKMYYIFYQGVDCLGITIATTRPETMFADIAVAVHPDDLRYRDLIGKKVIVPIINREIPIIADSRVIIDSGTGALKITPAHDDLDWEIGQDNGLEIIEAIDQNGLITLGPLKGLDREDAKAQLPMLLGTSLCKTEDIEHCVPCGDRSNSVIEILPMMQWFCDMKPLAENALSRLNEIRFTPESRVKTMKDYLENIKPWCLSRQLWWGHRIPIWTDNNGKFVAAKNEDEAYHKSGALPDSLKQETDVLDTWFSSGIWTIVTEYDSKVTDLLITGYDIINAWVARMIMLSLFLVDEIPFTEVLLTGLVRDRNGAKMSKTVGNVINPVDLIERSGADATRLLLVEKVLPGHDVALDPNMLRSKQEFLTKIWNVSIFCLMKKATIQWPDQIQKPWNQRWVNRLNEIERIINDTWQNHRYADLYQTLYHGFWEEFANLYLEGAKVIWCTETAAITGASLSVFLKWLYPIIPGITMRCYAEFTTESICEWPKIPQCDDVPEVLQWIIFASEIRKYGKMLGVKKFYTDYNIDPILLKAITGLEVIKDNRERYMIDLGYAKLSCDVELVDGFKAIQVKLQDEHDQLALRQKYFNSSTPIPVIEKNHARVAELKIQIEFLERCIKETRI